MKTYHMIALPLLLTASAAAAQTGDIKVRYGLSVRQHEALPQLLTNSRIDEILAAMSELAQNRDSTSDVACGVEYIRHGTVGTFASDEIPFSINSAADFNKVGAAPGSIKVVGAIRWCGTLGANIIGCANTPGSGMAVVRLSSTGQEAILWEHEFAHTTGSPHRDMDRQVMRPAIRVDMREFNQVECDRILNASFIVHPVPSPPGGLIAAKAPAAGDGSPAAATAAPLEGPPTTAQTPAEGAASGPPEPVTEFVSKTYFEGVPFNQASRYTNEDVPKLAAVLDDSTKQEAWGNAVATLGAIGTEQAKRELLDYLLRDPNATLSAAEYLAKSNVPVALGWLVHQSRDKEALELLIKATNGDWWTKEANINWSTPIFKDRESLIQSLVASAIVGLTLTGAEEARIRLEQLQAQLVPGAPAAALSEDEADSLSGLSPEARSSMTSVSPVTREAVTQNGGESFLKGQLQEFKTLTTQGLQGYYAQ